MADDRHALAIEVEGLRRGDRAHLTSIGVDADASVHTVTDNQSLIVGSTA